MFQCVSQTFRELVTCHKCLEFADIEKAQTSKNGKTDTLSSLSPLKKYNNLTVVCEYACTQWLHRNKIYVICVDNNSSSDLVMKTRHPKEKHLGNNSRMPLTKIISTRWPSHLEIPPSRLPIVPVDKQQHQWPLSWEGPAIASATLLVSQGRGQIFLTDGWTIPNAGWNWMEKNQNTFGRTKRHAKSRTFHGHMFHSIPTWSDF